MITIDWTGLGSVIGIGLIAGVGVVALYAIGVRALVAPEGSPARPSHPAGIAAVCFTLCAALAGTGIYVLLAK